MVVITLNFTVIMISIYRSLLGQLDYTMDSTLHLRTSFVMWYVLSPLSSASSSSLSFFFFSSFFLWLYPGVPVVGPGALKPSVGDGI